MIDKVNINDETNLYDNYTNYLYSVKKSKFFLNEDENKYILFNPSIHYWVCLDEIGAEIYREVHNSNNIGTIKKNLIDKYSINEDIFNEDVLPMIGQLIENKFITFNKTAETAEWMNQNVDIDNIEHYPFNDIYISLSDECNLNCIYCFNKEDRKKRLKDKISCCVPKEKIVELLKEFKDMSGTGVVFTGGEPTLNKNLLYFCKCAKEIGLEPHFITNGTLLNNMDLDELFDSVDSFGISLDSVVQSEIDQLWLNKSISVENDIFKTLEKVNNLSKKKKQIKINIMPIVSALNIGSMKKLVSIVADKLSDCEVTWSMTQFSPIGKEEVDKLLSVTEEEYVYSVAESLKDTYLKKESMDKKVTPDELTLTNNKITAYAFSNSGKMLPPIAPKVITCAPSFFVANNGDVYPCQGFEKEENRLGNIMDNSLRELFNKDEFTNVRKRVVVNNIESCANCELRFVCTNKCGGCMTTCDKDMNQCKNITVQRLYLQTQLA